MLFLCWTQKVSLPVTRQTFNDYLNSPWFVIQWKICLRLPLFMQPFISCSCSHLCQRVLFLYIANISLTAPKDVFDSDYKPHVCKHTVSLISVEFIQQSTIAWIKDLYWCIFYSYIYYLCLIFYSSYGALQFFILFKLWCFTIFYLLLVHCKQLKTGTVLCVHVCTLICVYLFYV
jgi:hypothetical protein